MSLTPGTRLGPYAVAAQIGAGGMGEVYRARDTKLDRDVALKLLPESFATDPDRLMRFEREAKTLASLNHPNIAAIHGIEGHALVMELVEGEDLAQRIAGGPIPIDEAVPIATQIAAAIEAAHDQGIIHRDLKPANIKVRGDGTVKVLDFGLAKALDPAAGGRDAGTANALANSPTITSPAMTMHGVILGTAGYMSPEQARGKVVDKRTDMWAFGCVLYEMLTGRRAFDGETTTDVLGAIVRAEPDWTRLPADTPPAVRRVVTRCLRKDPALRLAHASAARLDLMDSDAGTAAGATPATSTRAFRGVALAAVAGAIVAAVVGAAVLRPWNAPSPSSPPRPLRLAVVPPIDQPLVVGWSGFAMSPDGSFVLYTAVVGGKTQLMVRHLDRLDPVPLADTENVRGAAISPDGKWVAFGVSNALKKIPVAGGGAAITLCVLAGPVLGLSWGADDRIVFGAGNTNGRLLSVPAAGGTPEHISTRDPSKGEQQHVWPFIIPGSDAVLFTVRSAATASERVAILDLKSGAHRILLPSASAAAYMHPGYVVYRSGSSLWAAAFDRERGELSGDPFMVAPAVAPSGPGALYAVSQQGALAYVSGETRPAQRELVWVDANGREEKLPAPPHPYRQARLSPDETRVLAAHSDDIWLWTIGGGNLSRLTFGEVADVPIWSADGQRVIYTSAASGVANLWWRRADGTGSPERLTTSTRPHYPQAATRDGKYVVFREDAESGNQLMWLSLERPSTPEVLLPLPFGENNSDVSPDGRWLAYQQNANGNPAIFVQPFPNVGGGRWQVSTGGGAKPRFSRDGARLYFMSSGNTVVTSAAVVASSGSFSVGETTIAVSGVNRFFNQSPGRPWDVSKAGRFLMVKDVAGTTPDGPGHITVLANFLEAKR